MFTMGKRFVLFCRRVKPLDAIGFKEDFPISCPLHKYERLRGYYSEKMYQLYRQRDIVEANDGTAMPTARLQ